ncbi:MAG: BlaI/MecI/CopY family transcriptional regulator [Gemmatimonadaceae bacterium]|jgi:predicted transcriptional regulator
MPTLHVRHLGRRERQIMDAVYRLGNPSAQDVLKELPDPPSYSAVRGMLRLLEKKGYLTHAQEGPRYIYMPTTKPEVARRSALKHLLKTFFNDSRETAVAALLDVSDKPLSPEEHKRITKLLKEALTSEDYR